MPLDASAGVDGIRDKSVKLSEAGVYLRGMPLASNDYYVRGGTTSADGRFTVTIFQRFADGDQMAAYLTLDLHLGTWLLTKLRPLPKGATLAMDLEVETPKKVHFIKMAPWTYRVNDRIGLDQAFDDANLPGSLATIPKDHDFPALLYFERSGMDPEAIIIPYAVLQVGGFV
jgi:hypothetical protein